MNLGSIHKKLQESNPSVYQNTNQTAIPQITDAINQNLLQLNLIQNQLNLKNNVQQELLLKQKKLIQFENDRLYKQLQMLETIQSNILNKNAILQQINVDANKKDANIQILICSIVFIVLLLINIFLYGFKIISFPFFMIVIIFLLLLYICILIFYYNIFLFGDSISGNIQRNINKTEKALQKWGEIIQTDINDSLESTWIQNHCSKIQPTSPEENGSGTEESIYSSGYNQLEDGSINENNIAHIGNTNAIKETSGYFYYDASSPAQQLIPTPIPSTINLSNRIEWVDYSQNGTNQYNHNTQQRSSPLISNTTTTSNI